MLTRFGSPLAPVNISGTYQYMTLLLIWDHKEEEEEETFIDLYRSG